MQACHNCAHAASIAANEFENTPWEETPCANCPQENEDAASRRTLEFVEDRAPGPVRWPPPEEPAEESVLPLSVLAEALRGFLELPPRVFRAVQLRFKGESYALIAKELEVTPQAVEIQLRRALEAHPHLKQLLPAKAKRQAARKRRRMSMARRGKLGTGASGV